MARCVKGPRLHRCFFVAYFFDQILIRLAKGGETFLWSLCRDPPRGRALLSTPR